MVNIIDVTNDLESLHFLLQFSDEIADADEVRLSLLKDGSQSEITISDKLRPQVCAIVNHEIGIIHRKLSDMGCNISLEKLRDD